MRIPIVLCREPDLSSEYKVEVPDFLNCTSSGDTTKVAIDNIKEVITIHIEEALCSGGDSVLELLPIEEHLNNPDYACCSAWDVVDIDETKLKSFRARKN